MIGATPTDFILAHIAKIIHFAIVLVLPWYLHGNSAVGSHPTKKKILPVGK